MDTDVGAPNLLSQPVPDSGGGTQAQVVVQRMPLSGIRESDFWHHNRGCHTAISAGTLWARILITCIQIHRHVEAGKNGRLLNGPTNAQDR